MYYFKKMSLLNRKQRLTRKKGKLKSKLNRLKNPHYTQYDYFEEKAIKSDLEVRITLIEDEITCINENLEYLQKEISIKRPKVSNNSLNVGLKNESGAKIDFPTIIEK